MATVQDVRAEEQLSAVTAKLDQERKANKVLSDEVNRLRNRVVDLEDKSKVDDLEKKVADLTAKLADMSAYADATGKKLAKAERDLAAAAPALAVVAAIKAV